jgi:hypothetical protein
MCENDKSKQNLALNTTSDYYIVLQIVINLQSLVKVYNITSSMSIIGLSLRGHSIDVMQEFYLI